MRRSWFALFVATAGLALVGTRSIAAGEESSTSADERQARRIQARIHAANDLRNDHIEVTVDDGIALLEGTVDSAREITEAQRLAQVDGIVGVISRLRIHRADE